MTHNEFKTTWGKQRDDFARYGAQVDGATLIDQMLSDLEDATTDHHEVLLNLTDAAAECGYHAESLGRMVRNGELHNHGRKGAPRVKRGDLPRHVRRRPGVRVGVAGSYDPVADAQSLRDQ
ncbi:MAG TPA: hypothetical protein VIK25_04315 [Gemmatimonadaceae bacterium]